MIRYRPFRNSDPPKLVDVWRSQPPVRTLAQPMTVALFESLVLAKPYFNPQGLIVAVDGEQIVGFAHAGFGPNDERSDLDYEMGTTAMLLVRPHAEQTRIRQELLDRSESYLRSRGAKLLYAGCINPITPFYLGLYGGSELPGVADSDAAARDFFRSRGYREIDQALVFHADLASLRPPIDRRQLELRRRATAEIVADPRSSDWWDACAFGPLDRARVTVRRRDASAVVASAQFWNMEAFSRSWGVHSVGLIDLHVDEPERRAGLATFMIGETVRYLQQQGVALLEVQTMQRNAPAAALFHKVGFQQIDRGAVFRKET